LLERNSEYIQNKLTIDYVDGKKMVWATVVQVDQKSPVWEPIQHKADYGICISKEGEDHFDYSTHDRYERYQEQEETYLSLCQMVKSVMEQRNLHDTMKKEFITLMNDLKDDSLFVIQAIKEKKIREKLKEM
jgi:hypothetical protein